MVARPRRHPEIWLPSPPRSMSAAANSRSPTKRASLFAAGACHRIDAAAAQSARRRSRRRPHLSRHPGCRSAADAGGAKEARRRGRRRIARTGSGLWPRQGRRAGDAGSSDGPADGAPARCAGGGIVEIAGRAQGHRGSAQCQYRAYPWRDARRGRRTDGRTPDRRRCGDLRGRHPAQYRAGQGSRHSPSIAASSSTIICRPACRISSRSANAPSIAASVTAWSSRPTSRRACWRGIWRARRRPMAAAWSRPI